MPLQKVPNQQSFIPRDDLELSNGNSRKPDFSNLLKDMTWSVSDDETGRERESSRMQSKKWTHKTWEKLSAKVKSSANEGPHLHQQFISFCLSRQPHLYCIKS